MNTKPKSRVQRQAKLNLRLPQSLRNKLKNEAVREGRSMNAQAVQILSEKLSKEGDQRSA